jgi:ADP-ribose pyrophosphatase YjhB (NUDIX family)
MLEHISCRAAALIIKDQKILTAKNIEHPSYYVVGGGIEIYESSEKAIIREILEETGFEAKIDRLAIIQERFFEVDSRKHHEIVFFYLIKNSSEMNIPDNCFTDQGAKENLHWLPINDLSSFNIVPEFLKTKIFDEISGIEHIISYD